MRHAVPAIFRRILGHDLVHWRQAGGEDETAHNANAFQKVAAANILD